MRVGKTTERNSFNFSTTYWDNDYEDINHSDWKLGINITNSLQLTNWLHFDTGVYLKYGKEKNQSYLMIRWSMQMEVILWHLHKVTSHVVI